MNKTKQTKNECLWECQFCGKRSMHSIFVDECVCPHCKKPFALIRFDPYWEEKSMKTTIINIHKKKGIRPQFDIYIGRKVRFTEFTQDSVWANPFSICGREGRSREEVLKMYETYIRALIQKFPKIYNLEALRGKRLGCWCKPNPCHGDILLKILEETQ